MLQPPSRLEQGGPPGGAQLSGSGSGDRIPCGPVRHESESDLRGCKSDESGICSLGPPSQPLPIADVAASAFMRVEVVDCRAFRPEARVADNEAYCRSWRRAV